MTNRFFSVCKEFSSGDEKGKYVSITELPKGFMIIFGRPSTPVPSTTPLFISVEAMVTLRDLLNEWHKNMSNR